MRMDYQYHVYRHGIMLLLVMMLIVITITCATMVRATCTQYEGIGTHIILNMTNDTGDVALTTEDGTGHYTINHSQAFIIDLDLDRNITCSCVSNCTVINYTNVNITQYINITDYFNESNCTGFIEINDDQVASIVRAVKSVNRTPECKAYVDEDAIYQFAKVNNDTFADFSIYINNSLIPAQYRFENLTNQLKDCLVREGQYKAKGETHQQELLAMQNQVKAANTERDIWKALCIPCFCAFILITIILVLYHTEFFNRGKDKSFMQ